MPISVARAFSMPSVQPDTCGGRSTPPRLDRGGEGGMRSAGVFGRASSVPVMFRDVPTRGEAHGDGETALLSLVEALIQRLLGVGQTP